MVSGFAILSQTNIEQPLAVVVDEIPYLSSPLRSEIRFVAGEDESIVWLST